MSELEFDLVVAGSGSAGMTTAIVAAKRGLKVLLVEKTEYFGGITALSGGGCWIPENHLMAQVGLTDTRQAAERYIQQVVGNYLRADILDAFLDNGPDMLRFMLDNTEVKFMPRKPAPDYYTDIEGGMIGGRSLGSVVFDGRRLGPWFRKLRPPLQPFNAPLGMMMGPLELMHVTNAGRSLKSAWFAAKLFGGYARDRLSHRRGTRVTMGNALAARLLRSALDAGVTLWDRAPARRLLHGPNGVTGVVVEHEGRDVAIQARQGVVLATGGFSADPAMRARYFPHADQHQTLVPGGNTGDGLKMATDAGAVMAEPNRRNAAWATVSLWKKRDGTVEKCPHFFMDLPKPGCITVNQAGKRFGDEANLELPVAMHDTGSVPAYVICDSRCIRKYGLGLVWPGGLRMGMLKRDGYLIEAPTLEALAAKLKIDAAGLADTVERMNRYAETGEDLDFHRGASALDRSIGDPAHAPNPCLGKIETAPFYAVEVFPGDVTSTAGLKVDANGQALDSAGRPIRGLFACGLDMNSPWAGHGLGNGVYHAVNMTFGYIIANQAAARARAAEAA